jgi:hypothetical protein
MKDCRKVKSFGKTEFYTEYKHLRLINSRSDEFKAYSGRYFKAIEKEVFKLDWFIKKIPVKDRPALIRSLKKAGRRYFISDYTAYESHFVSEVMDAIECEMYRYCLENTTEGNFICDVLTGDNMLITNICLLIRRLKGRRMSGDMCTSLGNGFSNLMVALFCAHLHGGKLEGFVEGDDGIFSSTGPLFERDFERLGFTIKLEEIPDPCVGSFCGCVCSEDLQIVRDPRKFLQGFGWTSSFIHAGPRIMDELLRAKALSVCYETPHCPIIGVMAREALHITRSVKPRFIRDNYHDVPPDEFAIPDFEPTSETRILFEHMYGVSTDTQLLCEEAICRGDFKTLSDLVGVPDHVRHYSERYIVQH